MYYSAVCVKGKSARVEEALILLYEMEAVNLKLDITYFILIHGLSKKGDIQRAIQLYEEMCSREIFPNHFTHSAILLGLCERGNLSEARKYFDNLITSDLVEDIVLYNIMMDGYVNLGDIAEAVHLYHKLTPKKIIIIKKRLLLVLSLSILLVMDSAKTIN